MKARMLLALAVALTVFTPSISPLSKQAQAVTVGTESKEDARLAEGKQLKQRLIVIEGKLKGSNQEVKRQAEEDYRQIGLEYLAWAKKYGLPVKRETMRGPSSGGKTGAGGMMAKAACGATKRTSDGKLICNLVSSDVDSTGRMHCVYDCVLIDPSPGETKR